MDASAEAFESWRKNILAIAPIIPAPVIAMSNGSFFVTRTVAQVVGIPPLLLSVLERFRTAEINRDDYCELPFGDVGYAHDFLRPYGHAIRSCIPSTVCTPDDLPVGRAAELEKYVLSYIERAVGTGST